MVSDFLAFVQIWTEYFTSVIGCLEESWGSEYRGSNLEKNLYVQKCRNILVNTRYPWGIMYVRVVVKLYKIIQKEDFSQTAWD